MSGNTLFKVLKEKEQKRLEELKEEARQRKELRKKQKENKTDSILDIVNGAPRFVTETRTILYTTFNMLHKSFRRRILAALYIYKVLLRSQEEESESGWVNLHLLAKIVTPESDFSDLMRHQIACVSRDLTEKKLLEKSTKTTKIIGKNNVPYNIPSWKITALGVQAHLAHSEAEKTIIISSKISD